MVCKGEAEQRGAYKEDEARTCDNQRDGIQRGRPSSKGQVRKCKEGVEDVIARRPKWTEMDNSGRYEAGDLMG